MATLGEPFILSSYKTSNKSRCPTLWVTHTNRSHTPDGLVTVTVQGEGIHVLNLSTLRPAISYALGPSTYFSCPVNSVCLAEDQCITYAVIESSSDLGENEEGGMVVWFWVDSLSNPTGKKKEKKSALLPSKIQKVYCLDSPYLLLLSPTGDLTLTDADVQPKCHRLSTASNNSVLASFFFKNDCEFTPRDTPRGCPVLVLFSKEANAKDMKTEAIAIVDNDDGNGERFVSLGEFRINIEPDTITCMSCNASGHISILTQTGIWNFYRITSSPDFTLTQSCNTLSLSPGALSMSCAQTLALTSSHILLCSLPQAHSQQTVVKLLIWDTAYSVVLAAHTFNIPSNLAQSQLDMSLTPASSTTALLTLSSPSPGQARPAIFAVPYSVPSKSTIAQAIGRYNASAMYLSQTTSSSDNSLNIDPEYEHFLADMRTTIARGDRAAASAIFFDAVRQQGADKDQTPVGLLEDAVVAQLLSVVWAPHKNRASGERVLICHDVFEWLLEKGLVGRRCLDNGPQDDGGVLNSLIKGMHWDLLPKVVENVPDITENDIILALYAVFSANKSASPPSGIPTLEYMISSCVKAPWSAAPLRYAIYSCLKDPEALIRMLEVLVSWLRLLTIGLGVENSEEQQNKDIPPVSRIVDFLQCFLDAASLALLSTSASHGLLRQLSHLVQQSIDVIGEEGQLCPHLESFVGTGKAGKGNLQGKRSRHKKKVARKQADWVVGSYRIEALVL